MDPRLAPTPELEKYYNLNFQLPLSNAGVKVATGQAEAQNSQREFDVKQQAQKLQDAAEGKGYQQVPKADGGYTFLDPTGKEVSAFQYSRATGKSTDSILKDSQNPIDQQYTRDYNNLQDFLDVSMSGDKEALKTYYEQNPALASLSPQSVIQRFQEAYPTVYGLRQSGQTVGQTFIPNLAVLKSGGGGPLPR